MNGLKAQMILGAVVGCGRAWGSFSFFFDADARYASWSGRGLDRFSLRSQDLIAVQHEPSTISNWRCTRNSPLPNTSNSLFNLWCLPCRPLPTLALQQPRGSLIGRRKGGTACKFPACSNGRASVEAECEPRYNGAKLRNIPTLSSSICTKHNRQVVWLATLCSAIQSLEGPFHDAGSWS